MQFCLVQTIKGGPWAEQIPEPAKQKEKFFFHDLVNWNEHIIHYTYLQDITLLTINFPNVG